MAFFDSDGAAIHYLEQGEGPPVVLIHSMASNLRHSWIDTGWIEHLRPSFRLIALDCRGHGLSAKSYDDPEFYTAYRMADDTIRLLDHLGIGRTLLAGYSMGASVALNAAVRYGSRVRALAIGGISSRTYKVPPRAELERLVEVLNAEDPSIYTDKAALWVRSFCQRNGNDPKALAAFTMHRRPDVEQSQLSSIQAPVLVAAGTRDTIVQGVDELIGSLPNAHLLTLEGRTHLDALADPHFRQAAAEFFAAAPP